MNKEWSLEVLYKGFHDEKYKADKVGLQALTEELISFSEGLNQDGKEEANLIQAVEYLEQFQLLRTRLSYYVALRQSVNTSDSETVNEMNGIEKTIKLILKANGSNQ